MINSIRKFENLHIACWLIKDTCWVMDIRTLGIIMIFPTLFLAFYITYKFRQLLSELYHNLAVCFWIMANTIWMIGEFFFDDTLRPYSIVFFLAGLLVILYYYLFVYRKLKVDSEIE
ncbi:hypothetical protein SAMN05421813_10438 [Daejeonella rubra]|uniref:Uncharacterized protein n=1 Tax=Daejeonella rubra TaxID=990371 RepID=A0A1G9P933_9SPHI|nr:hypothetical protein [Daejeonella rubra]SDL95306.1 hypothetical protein SAMN05421813_10438 [Daejeonella rubra]